MVVLYQQVEVKSEDELASEFEITSRDIKVYKPLCELMAGWPYGGFSCCFNHRLQSYCPAEPTLKQVKSS